MESGMEQMCLVSTPKFLLAMGVEPPAEIAKRVMPCSLKVAQEKNIDIIEVDGQPIIGNPNYVAKMLAKHIKKKI